MNEARLAFCFVPDTSTAPVGSMGETRPLPKSEVKGLEQDSGAPLPALGEELT